MQIKSSILLVGALACSDPAAPIVQRETASALRNALVSVSGQPLNATEVSVGGIFGPICSLDRNGSIACWGSGNSGPSQVAGPATFSAISAGGNYTCAIATGGDGYCWGSNTNGELGNGGFASSTTPVAVAGGLRFRQISTALEQSVSLMQTCAVTIAGAAYCWGSNATGQLGTGSSGGSFCPSGYPCETLPVSVSGGITFAEVSAGAGHTCGLSTSGLAYCWGLDGGGMLGTGRSIGPTACPSSSFGNLWTGCSLIPIAVAQASNYTYLSNSYASTCALTSASEAFCWGSNQFAQLGIGTWPGPVCDPNTFSVCTPMRVTSAGAPTLQSISVGREHACGLTPSGEAFCWGYSDHGELGDGQSTGPDSCSPFNHPCALAPVAVSGGLTFKSISAGGWRTCGVTIADEVYCWGDNTRGDLGVGYSRGPSQCTPIVGGTTSCALVPTRVIAASLCGNVLPCIDTPADGSHPQSQFVSLAGSAEPGHTLQILVNGSPISSSLISADGEGRWEALPYIAPFGPDVAMEVVDASTGSRSNSIVVHPLLSSPHAGPPIRFGTLLPLRRADIIVEGNPTSAQLILYGARYTHAALYLGGDQDGTPLIAEAVPSGDAGVWGQVRSLPLEESLAWTGVTFAAFRPATPLPNSSRDAIVAWASATTRRGLPYWDTERLVELVVQANSVYVLLGGVISPRVNALFRRIDAMRFSTTTFICSTLVWRSYLEGTAGSLDLASPNNMSAQPSSLVGNLPIPFRQSFIRHLAERLVVPETFVTSPKLKQVL